MEKDLAERADAARKDFEDQDKIADAMEAAMESVDNMADEREVRGHRIWGDMEHMCMFMFMSGCKKNG